MEAGGGNNMVLTESSGSVRAENFLIWKLNNVLTTKYTAFVPYNNAAGTRQP